MLVLSGAIVWDRVNDGFWPRHALFTSLIVVAVAVGGVSAAVSNAIYDAVGVRVRDLPFRPDRVLSALQTKPKGGLSSL